MLRTLMMSAAVSALMVSGALAQANPPATAPAARNDAAETHSPKFIQAQGTDNSPRSGPAKKPARPSFAPPSAANTT
jgi:hypothetical protein